MLMWLAIVLGVLLIGCLIAISMLLKRRTPEDTATDTPRDNAGTDPVQGDDIPFETEATVQLVDATYTLAFNVTRFDYRILGQHGAVLAAIKTAISSVIGEQKYFPRRPSLLPKLLRAINTGDSHRDEIVRLILQDPLLVGNVLKRANSVFYRTAAAPVESVDRAVMILGYEGLRAPAAAAIMQPVFQQQRGTFERFAPTTWELAQRTAVAAEVYARRNNIGDSFVAHLLGMLVGLGRMVIFRLTLDKYKAQANILPKPEVFIRAMLDHGQEVTRMVAATWEMSDQFLSAIDSQIKQVPPNRMTPLARTLYFANLCGALALLHNRGLSTDEEAKNLLVAQGLDVESFASMWAAACKQELS